MEINFAPQVDSSMKLTCFVLLCACITLLCSIGLIYLQEKELILNAELAAMNETIISGQQQIYQTQQEVTAATLLQERWRFLQSIRNEQQVISHMMDRILAWLPLEVTLSSMSVDESSILSLTGTSQTLSSFAVLLRQINADEEYKLLSFSPLANHGSGYNFSLQVHKAKLHGDGDDHAVATP